MTISVSSSVTHQSLLQLIQRFCIRTGLTPPPAVVTNTDLTITQLMGLLEEECQDLARRAMWQGLVDEATFTSVAAEDQGEVAAIAGNGFQNILPKTFWDRAQRLPIIGGADSQEWQWRKAMAITGPLYTYRIRGDHLLVSPALAAGHLMAFEYKSGNWCSHGSMPQNFFSGDADTVVLPEELVLLGLRWRWKKEKKFAYAEDFNTYENQVADATARDRGARDLHMDEGLSDFRPGVVVPAGSWPL